MIRHGRGRSIPDVRRTELAERDLSGLKFAARMRMPACDYALLIKVECSRNSPATCFRG